MKRILCLLIVFTIFLNLGNCFLNSQNSIVSAAENGGFKKKIEMWLTNWSLEQKFYNSSYNYGDQTLQFNTLVKLKEGYLLAGRERKAGILCKVTAELQEVERSSLEIPVKEAAVTDDGNLILAGHQQLISLNLDGTKNWQVTTPGRINSLAIVDKDIVVVGAKQEQGWVGRFTSKGELKWEYSAAGTGRKHFAELAVTNEGKLILVGEEKQPGQWKVESKGLIVCLASTGKEIWANSIARGAGWTNGLAAITTAGNNHFLIAGQDGYLMKVTADGKQQWVRSQPGFTVNYTSVVKVEENKFVVAGVKSEGRKYGGGANDYPYLIKVNGRGEKLKSWVFTRVSDGSLQALLKRKNNLLAVGGVNGQSSLHQTEGYLVKLKSKK